MKKSLSSLVKCIMLVSCIIFCSITVIFLNIDENFNCAERLSILDKILDDKTYGKVSHTKLYDYKNDRSYNNTRKGSNASTFDILDMFFGIEIHDDYEKFALNELNHYESTLTYDDGVVSELAYVYAKAGFTL